MYAIGLYEYGGPAVLQGVQLPDPHPSPGQVRVRVRAAAINPVDVMVRDGSLAAHFENVPLPLVPGMDIAGTIDEIGDEVDHDLSLAVGDAVVAVVDNAGTYGGYSQYVCVPVQSVIPVPAGASFVQAGSFLMNALTARHALDTLALPPGSTVLVTGAAGAVGTYALALGHGDQLRMLALASPADEAYVRNFGAAEWIARGANVCADTRRLCPAGVDAVIDCAGLGASLVPAVRDGGTIIVLRPDAGVALARGVRTLFVNVRSRVTDHEAITRLGQQVSSGRLPLRVAAVYPAAEAAAAHRRFDHGGLRGRIVLDFEQVPEVA